MVRDVACWRGFQRYPAGWWQADTVFLWGGALVCDQDLTEARIQLESSFDVYSQLKADRTWLDRAHRELPKL